MMLNLSYLTAINAKNQLLFHIQSISAISGHSYRAAFNKRTQCFMKANEDCSMAFLYICWSSTIGAIIYNDFGVVSMN